MNFGTLQGYRLNIRFLGFWLGLALILGIGSFALYRHQLHKLGDAYLGQADGSRDRGEPEKEADYLRRYLALQPGDTGVRLRLGMLQARTAARPRDRLAAFQVLEEVLRADPSLPKDVRLQAIRLALHPTLNLHEEAKPHVEVLLRADPTSAEYASLMADCLVLARDFKSAETYLATAVKSDGGRIASYVRLAAIQRFELKRFDEADATLAALAAKNPTAAAAFVAIAEHRRREGKRDLYGVAVKRASELAPGDPEVVLTAADYALAQADESRLANDPAARGVAVAEAVKLYESVITTAVPKLPPLDPAPEPGSAGERLQGLTSRAYHTLVAVLVQEGRKADAEAWARKQAATFPGSMVGQADLVEVAIGRGNLDEAEAVAADLGRAGYPTPYLDFYAGRIAAMRSRWPDACRKLESAVEGFTASPELSRRANLLLGLCYRETGELDRRYEAFRRAVPPEPFDPTWGAAVLGVAEALTELGRPNDAAVEYTTLAALVPAANVPLGRLLLDQALRQPAGKQDWSPVERAVAAAPAGAETELLRADLASARSDPAAARKVLEKALAADPTSVRLWVARILLEGRVKDLPRATELLGQARAKLGATIELRSVEVRLLASGPDKAAAAAGLVRLAADGASLPPKDRTTLLNALATAAEQVGRRDLARRWLDELAATRPDDVSLQSARFNLALLDGDEKTAVAILETVERVAGAANTVPSKVLRAFFLLWKAEATKDPALLAQASGLLTGLERQRAGWSLLHVAQARVADATGDPVTAAKKYRQAVDLGEVSPDIVVRLLELYYLTQQHDKAAEVMQQVPSVKAGGSGAELMAEFSLASRDFGQAKSLARGAVQADSTDPAKLLWLSRMLILGGDLAEAEAPLRRATTLAPKRPEGWVALVQLLTALKRAPEAAAAMEQCRAQTDPKDTALALAQCAETLGQAAAAQKWYGEALAARPGDPAVLRAVALSRLRGGDPAGARKLLEQVLASAIKSKEDEAFARRTLATILSNSSDFATARQALETLGFASPEAAAKVTGREPIEELRARVQVLTRLRGRDSRQAAVRLLGVMESRLPLAPQDERQYDQLLESLGDWETARLRFAAALTAANSPPALVADYVGRLLRHGELAEARTVLDKLLAKDPNAELAVGLQVLLSAAEGKREQAVREAGRLAKPDVAAAALERAGLLPEAEVSYRKFVSQADTPSARVGLARFLGRAEKFSEAWAGLDAAWATLPPEVAVNLACEILMSCAASAPPAEVAKLLARVEAAAAAKPSLAAHLAAARSLAGDQPAALQGNRQVLARDPTNLLALNNQAFLVAAHEKNAPAALALVRAAQGVAGPLPGLLDTEGVILMLAGEPDKAVEKFKASIVEDPGAVTYFHLAHAYHALNLPRDAKAALDDARRLRVRPGDFHPLEQPTFARVVKEIDAR